MTENEIIKNLDDIWTFGHEPTDEERLAANKAFDLIQELQQYRAIGTVEECREAMERQNAKKVSNRTLLRDLNGNPYTVRGDCPNCGSINLVSTNTDYCNACGQKLDWSDTP